MDCTCHYLNQCWLIFSEVRWHSPQYYFTGIDLWNLYESLMNVSKSTSAGKGSLHINNMPISLLIFHPKSSFYWKKCLAMIQLLVNRLLQMFADAMTVMLSCHLQTFVVINWWEFWMRIKLNYKWKFIMKWSPHSQWAHKPCYPATWLPGPLTMLPANHRWDLPRVSLTHCSLGRY